jgi:hypothetical protein
MRLFLCLLMVAVPCAAAPREFPFTWTSPTLARGENQLEAWLTPRLTRTDDFARYDTRLVWARGVLSNLESQLSLDWDFERTDTRNDLDPKLTSWWRWAPVRGASPFAAGALGRASLGFDQLELEARLMTDVRVQKAVVALNLAASRAFFWKDRTGIDTRLEGTFAAKYSFSPHASFGLETRVKSAWQGNDYRGTAVYLGPVLTWTHPSFWVSIGGYTQVAADKAPADRASAEPQELRDNERFVLRIMVGGLAQ